VNEPTWIYKQSRAGYWYAAELNREGTIVLAVGPVTDEERMNLPASHAARNHPDSLLNITAYAVMFSRGAHPDSIKNQIDRAAALRRFEQDKPDQQPPTLDSIEALVREMKATLDDVQGKLDRHWPPIHLEAGIGPDGKLYASISESRSGPSVTKIKDDFEPEGNPTIPAPDTAGTPAQYVTAPLWIAPRCRKAEHHECPASMCACACHTSP
jgi:hypothetical protein